MGTKITALTELTTPEAADVLAIVDASATQTKKITFANLVTNIVAAAIAALGLGTAATKNVAASGNAAAGEVVKGNDTRLSDARTPAAHTHTLAAGATDVTATAAELNALHNVRRYVALLSQSGTNAPAATVLENTLGGVLVWTRTATGRYTATLAGAFTSGKTVVFTQPPPFAATGVSRIISLTFTSEDAIDFQTTVQNGGDALSGDIDGALTATAVEIRVYPA